MENKTCAIIGGKCGICSSEFFIKYEKVLITLLEEQKVNTFLLIKSEFSLITANILQSLKSRYNFKIKFYSCDKMFKDLTLKNFFEKIFDEVIFVENTTNSKIIKDCIIKSEISLLYFDNEKIKLKNFKNFCDINNKKYIDLVKILN